MRHHLSPSTAPRCQSVLLQPPWLPPRLCSASCLARPGLTCIRRTRALRCCLAGCQPTPWSAAHKSTNTSLCLIS